MHAGAAPQRAPGKGATQKKATGEKGSGKNRKGMGERAPNGGGAAVPPGKAKRKAPGDMTTATACEARVLGVAVVIVAYTHYGILRIVGPSSDT